MGTTGLQPLPPGGCIGILGGGQLGRMLALAAAELGFLAHVYCPDPDSPALDVVRRATVAPYDDEEALAGFASVVDRVTYEFENVPHFTAAFLESRVPVLPREAALRITQDRLVEKRFIRSLGFSPAPFEAVGSVKELVHAVERLGRPSVLKARRFGYDGKGQTVIREGVDLAAAWAEIGEAPAVLEAFVPFVAEASVLTARGDDGMLVCYDIVENRHENSILRSSRVPARIGAETAKEALAIGRAVAEGLDYVGMLAVELFVVREEQGETLVVNEIAPRVHNSGHWTQDACFVSQFEQHIRAIAGWPLGDGTRHHDAEMTNLIGDDIEAWRDLAQNAGLNIHIYGKSAVRPGRKMGHVTRLLPYHELDRGG